MQLDPCTQRALFGELIACRHANKQGLGPANLVSVKACTHCYWSDKPCETPRPLPTLAMVTASRSSVTPPIKTQPPAEPCNCGGGKRDLKAGRVAHR